MLRTAVSLSLCFVVVTAAACPGAADAAKEAATDVGAAPHAQVDEARARIDKAEQKEKAAVDAAAAVTE
jgi:hypothetical protein